MHIPDNALSPSTFLSLGAVMVPIWKRAASNVKKELSKKRIPMLGLCAAFSFLIMMFNIPLPWGSTGHAVGGTLVAILIGPSAAVISITITLVIQAFFFGDGGILAIGANAFNMAFIMPFIGYYLYKLIRGKSNSVKRDYAAIFIASYLAINVSALVTGIEFGLQFLLFKDSLGKPMYFPYPLSLSIPSMVFPHLLGAGFLEGTVTVGIYSYLRKLSPEIIYEDSKPKLGKVYALIIILICLTPLGLIASGTAFGEWDKKFFESSLGFIPKGIGEGFSFRSIMPGYSMGKLPEIAGYVLSALLGVAIIFIMIKLIPRKENN